MCVTQPSPIWAGDADGAEGDVRFRCTLSGLRLEATAELRWGLGRRHSVRTACAPWPQLAQGRGRENSPPHGKRILSRSRRRLFTFQISSNSGPGCLGRMRGLSATDCDHFKVTSLHCPTHRLRLSFLKLGHSLPKRDFVGDTDHIFLFWGILDAEKKES